MKLVVFQIDVVDNLGNLTQTLDASQGESLEHGFKRAVFAVMSELGSKHVERNCAFDHFVIADEIETWALVDELLDEPCGSQPIDVQISASGPAPALVLCDVENSTFRYRTFGHLCRALRVMKRFLATLVGLERGGVASGIEKVVGGYALKLSMQLVDLILVHGQS